MMRGGIRKMMLCLLALVVLFPGLIARAEKPVTMAIDASVSAVGVDPSEIHILRMEAQGSYPMPGGGAGGSYDLTLNGSESRSFPAMSFDSVGSYFYTISQLPGSHALAVRYDSTVYELQVQVSRADSGLRLTAVMHRRGIDSKAASADFENTYVSPAVTQDDPPVRKQVTGDTPATAATFSFTMKGVSNTAGLSAMPMPEGASGGVRTVQLQAGQEKEFGAIRFDAPGTYVYQIAEVNDGQPGYTYDKSVYTLTYAVARSGDALQATKTVEKNGAAIAEAAFAFINTYGKTPTAEPTATIEIAGQKVWVDDGNAHRVRPDTVSIQLYANGVEVANAPLTWTSTDGDTWSFSFGRQPAADENGVAIAYTVKETPVPYYQTRIEGMTVTNTLEERQPTDYITISGSKTWNDADNAAGKRPGYITVRLLRNGKSVEQRTVTAANDWAYAFDGQPVDDGYGHTYRYTVREDAVSGYFARYRGYDIVNTPLSAKADAGVTAWAETETIESRHTATPIPRFVELTEERMEALLQLLDKRVALWGGLLATGDETPVYPYVFAGIGMLALAAVLLGRRRRG
ncbi:MAG: Cna B-type domain-containing protein [Clostridia bacterium]|nr:Cna B-type domain-containing protein [Clostridia bacterium]